MAKPTEHLDWTDGAAEKVVEPTAGKRLLGWIAAERPAFEFMNWLFWKQDEWNKYFDTEIDGVKATATVFDAVVGVGGTHADLATLMADADIATIKNVVVVSPQTLTVPVTIDQDDMKFTFKPQAVIAGIPTIDNGLIITGERVKIIDGRFINFDKGGANAIELDASASYCMISSNHFLNCDTPIVDNGTLNNLNNNIEEV